MAQFNGVMPDGIDLSQFEGIPDYLKNRQSLLSDHDPKRDKDLVVRFFTDSYFRGAETKAAGIPIFSTEVFIEVLMPDNKSGFVQLIKMDEKGSPKPSVQKWVSRFPKEWERFQKGIVSGYPLEKVPGLDKGVVATLAMVGVKTAEAFADLQGEIFEKLPSLIDEQKRVKKFLDSKDVITAQAERIKELEKLVSVNSKAATTISSNKAKAKSA